MERVLSHAVASCSSGTLSRQPSSLSSRRPLLSAAAVPRAAPLRVQAVAGLSRTEAAGSLLGHSLNAPSAEELGSPVTLVHSPEEFKGVLTANKDKLVVLMCKATHCRPCKMFARKYAMAARQYTDTVFLEIYGDETKATRQLMIDLSVRVTPTFVMFRNGEKVHNHGGINEANLHKYITKHLLPHEAGYGSFTEPDLSLAA